MVGHNFIFSSAPEAKSWKTSNGRLILGTRHAPRADHWYQNYPDAHCVGMQLWYLRVTWFVDCHEFVHLAQGQWYQVPMLDQVPMSQVEGRVCSGLLPFTHLAQLSSHQWNLWGFGPEGLSQTEQIFVPTSSNLRLVMIKND